MRLGIFYLSVILLVIESTLSEIFLLLTNRGLFSVKRMDTLFNGFRIWKFPGSVQDLLPRLIQPHDVVPARYDRQEVGLLGVTPEVDGNASVFVLLCRDVVERVGVVLVDRHPALVVVKGHRPEGVHRHVLRS